MAYSHVDTVWATKTRPVALAMAPRGRVPFAGTGVKGSQNNQNLQIYLKPVANPGHAAGAVVGDLAATGGNGPYTFTVSGGTDAAMFTVAKAADGVTWQLKTAGTPTAGTKNVSVTAVGAGGVSTSSVLAPVLT